jgi:hypothetical protein
MIERGESQIRQRARRRSLQARTPTLGAQNTRATRMGHPAAFQQVDEMFAKILIRVIHQSFFLPNDERNVGGEGSHFSQRAVGAPCRLEPPPLARKIRARQGWGTRHPEVGATAEPLLPLAFLPYRRGRCLARCVAGGAFLCRQRRRSLRSGCCGSTSA